MISKWIGALLVFFSCTGWGVSLAMSCRREEKLYCGLLRVLSYMKGELRYHLTSLPELCEQGAMEADGQIRAVFAVSCKKRRLCTDALRASRIAADFICQS